MSILKSRNTCKLSIKDLFYYIESTRFKSITDVIVSLLYNIFMNRVFPRERFIQKYSWEYFSTNNTSFPVTVSTNQSITNLVLIDSFGLPIHEKHLRNDVVGYFFSYCLFSRILQALKILRILIFKPTQYGKKPLTCPNLTVCSKQ